MDVLGEANLSCAADFNKGSPSVYSIAAYTDGGPPAVAIDLDYTVEQLLYGPGALLNPGLRRRRRKN